MTTTPPTDLIGPKLRAKLDQELRKRAAMRGMHTLAIPETLFAEAGTTIGKALREPGRIDAFEMFCAAHGWIVTGIYSSSSRPWVELVRHEEFRGYCSHLCGAPGDLNDRDIEFVCGLIQQKFSAEKVSPAVAYDILYLIGGCRRGANAVLSEYIGESSDSAYASFRACTSSPGAVANPFEVERLCAVARQFVLSRREA